MSATTLTPAERVVLRSKREGNLVTAEGNDNYKTILDRLTKKGVVRHRHGLIYELTPEGEDVLKVA